MWVAWNSETDDAYRSVILCDDKLYKGSVILCTSDISNSILLL